MKKGILVLFVLCALQISAQAQNNKGATTKDQTTQKATIEIKKGIANSVLNAQLVEMFGKDYSLEAKEVKAQLNKNIDNKKATYELRKLSLYALYGKDMNEHTARILE